jgi:hypothetical protein
MQVQWFGVHSGSWDQEIVIIVRQGLSDNYYLLGVTCLFNELANIGLNRAGLTGMPSMPWRGPRGPPARGAPRRVLEKN